MAIADVTDWIAENSKPGIIWFAKRLAANDTLATHAHQAGPYIPKEFLFEVFPKLNRPGAENPDVRFDLYIDSHSGHKKARAVWYNNKVRGIGTRNETRVTNLGGEQSALLDPDSTGAVAAFAFLTSNDALSPECHVWVCRHPTEEDVFEDLLGPIEPKTCVVWEPGTLKAPDLLAASSQIPGSCRLSPDEIPPAWLTKFPSGEDIIRKTLQMRPRTTMTMDARLVRRRLCEYEIFQSLEEVVYTPRIKAGFKTIGEFMALAQTVSQRRRSRSGNSLELHMREILTEEGLKSGTDFAYRPTTEMSNQPDFIFPSVAAYNDRLFPQSRLRMLAAKTTCKDRWRQVIPEAKRIKIKHLLTLQEGVSERQFRQMTEHRVVLVVPSVLHEAYPKSVRPHLISIETFVAELRLLNPV